MTLRDALPRLSALLVALGVLGGTLQDRIPARTASYREGWRVLETDLHAHTRFSDGFLSPFDLVLQARRRGLDVLAITEHNVIFPALMGRWFARATGGPTILIGEEVTTRRFHLHGVGLTERIDADLPLEGVIDAIHRQGGIAIAAHPVARYHAAFDAVLAKLDAAEVMHPIAFGGRGDGAWRWGEMRDFYEQALASGHRLTAVGSSDYHAFSVLGLCRTLVFARDDSAEAVLEALKAGRTVVYDLEGKAYGDPTLAAALEREPYLMPPQDYGYHGSGPLDRAARGLGWLGLVGLIVFGLRRG
jgi:PHP domain